MNRLFQVRLMTATGNFDDVTWLGFPIWQNVLDLWTLQEEISRNKPALLIETGTHRGGSALFYASLMDLLGHGHVFTIDVARIHTHTHPRVTFRLGSSTAAETVAAAQAAVDHHGGPVMVILDSDHRAGHVAEELEAYSSMVSPGSLLLVQDGVIDQLWAGRPARPGPLSAIRQFMERHPEFALDTRLERRFVITQHPMGWLRRLPDSPS